MTCAPYVARLKPERHLRGCYLVARLHIDLQRITTCRNGG